MSQIKVSPEQLKKLTEQHLRLYGRRLEAAQRGEPGYRPAELSQLIGIWRGIALKEYQWDLLDEPERNEVIDYVMSEGGGDAEEGSAP